MSNPIPLDARRQRAQREVHELRCEINKARADAKTWRGRYETGGGEKALRNEQRAQAHLIAVLDELYEFLEVNKELLTDETNQPETSDDEENS